MQVKIRSLLFDDSPEDDERVRGEGGSQGKCGDGNERETRLSRRTTKPRVVRKSSHT
jgi:hypothetical protein